MTNWALGLAAVGLLAVRLAIAGPGVTVERTARSAVALAPGAVLALNHRFGNLAVTGSVGESVVLDAKIAVSGRSKEKVRRLAEQIDLLVRPGAETLEVTTFYPDSPLGDSTLSYEVNLGVRAPEQSPLSVSNVFGDVQVQGMKDLCWAAVRYGRLELEGCSGAEVTGRYSDVNVVGSRGLLVVDNDFGNVVLRDVRGDVRVLNRFGRVEAERGRGIVFINNSFGDVECRQDSGTLAVDNRVGDVRAWIADEQLAMLSLLSRMGSVELNLVPGVDYRLSGRALRGEVLTGLPLQLIEEGTGQAVFGLAGERGPKIDIETHNGDIVVRAETLRSVPARQER